MGKASQTPHPNYFLSGKAFREPRYTQIRAQVQHGSRNALPARATCGGSACWFGPREAFTHNANVTKIK
jgi:hypothetical protein